MVRSWRRCEAERNKVSGTCVIEGGVRIADTLIFSRVGQLPRRFLREASSTLAMRIRGYLAGTLADCMRRSIPLGFGWFRLPLGNEPCPRCPKVDRL